MAKSQHLGTELDVGAEADEEEIGEEADERAREREEHGSGQCQRSIIHRPPGESGVYAWSDRKGEVEPTVEGLRHRFWYQSEVTPQPERSPVDRPGP
jgi:hypothetical protein